MMARLVHLVSGVWQIIWCRYLLQHLTCDRKRAVSMCNYMVQAMVYVGWDQCTALTMVCMSVIVIDVYLYMTRDSVSYPGTAHTC